MVVVSEYKPKKINNVNSKFGGYLMQFLPEALYRESELDSIIFKGQKIKTSYIIDLTHNLILKNSFKGENSFNLSSIILKERYGQRYNYYIEYLIFRGVIQLVKQYKKGKNARVYKLSDSVLSGKIERFKNIDSVLIKKYKMSKSSYALDDQCIIDSEIRSKLISDLSLVSIDYAKSIFYLDSDVDDTSIYEKNKYSVECIRDNHIFYHFDPYGRLHTNFTILKSFIRKNCLLINDMNTCEIDIPNSQPLFLCKLLSKNIDMIDKNEYNIFRKIVLNGVLYEHFMSNSGISDKKTIKEMIYRVLFGRNLNTKHDLLFMRSFPTIYEFIKFYKNTSGDYRVLSHELQRLESHFVFNVLIRKISDLDPNIPIVTIHDSIIFPDNYKNIVEEIFHDSIIDEFRDI